MKSSNRSGKRKGTGVEYTLDEYVRQEAPLFAEVNNMTVSEAEQGLRSTMEAYLRTLPVGEERRGPLGFGIYYTKLGRGRFVQRFEPREMEEAVRYR